jgi:hypothetical protein
MIADCEEDRPCHRAFPEVRQDVASTFAQLEGEGIRVQLPGFPNRVVLSRGRVAEWVRSQLYRPATAAALPSDFHQAAAGNWKPIGDGVLASARGADNELDLGLLFAVTCSEDLPYVREQDVPAATDNTFLGVYRLRQQQVACAGWPRSKLPIGYRNRLLTDIPTLFVTGDRDGDTPLWFTDHVASGFARHVIVVEHAQGHTGWNDCVARLHLQLVLSGTTDGLDPVCPRGALPAFKF